MIPLRTITGSRRLDCVAFVFLVSILLAMVPHLQVYHEGVPATLDLAAVSPDGNRTILDVPKPLGRTVPGVHWAERQIRVHAESELWKDLVPAEGHLEWTLTYTRRREQTKEERKVITHDPKEQ